MMKPLVLVAMFALASAGCGSRDHAKKNPGQSTPSDVEKNAPAATPGPTVFLRGRIEGERALVEVIARATPREIHGAAFRLRWDPTKLTFADAHASEAWSASAIGLAKEGLPGELVVVWTEKGGNTGVNADNETILGSIDFTVKTRDATDLAFRAERSTLRDVSGAPIPVEWRGVEVAPR